MQEITLATPGANEARCTLDNGVKYAAEPGETLQIMRSQHDLVVDCYAAGNRHKTITVPSGYNNWSTANIANGVAPGMAFDHLSGGMYDYPPVITVDFVGIPTYGYELPAYHNKDAPNPYNRAIEDYGPNTPRIPGDSSYMKRDVEKRSIEELNSNPFSVKGGAAPSPVSSAASPAASMSAPAERPKITTPGAVSHDAESLTRSMNPSVFK